MWIIMIDYAWIVLSTLPITFFFSINILEIKKFYFPEAGSNKVLQNAQRNKTQRLFKPLKSAEQEAHFKYHIFRSAAQPPHQAF